SKPFGEKQTSSWLLRWPPSGLRAWLAVRIRNPQSAIRNSDVRGSGSDCRRSGERRRRRLLLPAGKVRAKGGPDGGDGGTGGSVFARADSNLATLIDYRYHNKWKAESGVHGKGKNMSGKS